MLITSPASERTAFDNAVPQSDIRLILEGATDSFAIDRDGLRVGTSPVCELLLPSGPALHSVVHCQSGVTWIEAQEEASLIVNGRPRRRMALRDGDVLQLNGLEWTVRLRAVEETATALTEDLSLLSAEELCDRILAEQALVEEFSNGQRSGWSNLLEAVEAVRESEPRPLSFPVEAASSPANPAATDQCERLLEQIRELSEMVNGRSQELDDCENELVAATALLEEAQERVSQQIEGLLEQLQSPSVEMELRASA